MRWDAVIHGQPISTNHAYVNRLRQTQRGGVPVVKADGSPVMQRYRALTQEALQYQNDAQLILQTRRPSGWKPVGQIRVMFDFCLGRDIDDDNAAIKLLYDALKKATGIDDKLYLHCVRSKTTGHKAPYVLMTVDDDAQHR